MILIHILGGIALILFGIRFLRKGLERMFCGHLIEWLAKATRTRWRALAGGFAFAAVAPSSTAVSLVSLRLLDDGKLPTERLLAMFLGANIGITVMVQLMTIPLYDAYPLLFFIGILGFLFARRNQLRGIGQSLLALGFIFQAMALLSHAARLIEADPHLTELTTVLLGFPWLLLIATALLTVVSQSSTATIGIGLALIQSGLADTQQLIPVILGANIGIALTALIAGWYNLEGRRLGFANLLLKLACILPIIGFSALPTWIASFFADDPASIANLHTAFNVVVAAIGIFILTPILGLVRWMIPSPEPDPVALHNLHTSNHSYLDPSTLDTPTLALINATREELTMADTVQQMLSDFQRALNSGDRQLAQQIKAKDDRVDEFNRAIRMYLSRISEATMQPHEIHLQFTLLNFSGELETIADIIDKHLCDLLAEDKKLPWSRFSPPEQQAVNKLFAELDSQFKLAAGLLISKSTATAQLLVERKEFTSKLCREIHDQYFTRIQDDPSLSFTPEFTDTLSSLRRISSHIASLGYNFLPPTPSSLRS